MESTEQSGATGRSPLSGSKLGTAVLQAFGLGP